VALESAILDRGCAGTEMNGNVQSVHTPCSRIRAVITGKSDFTGGNDDRQCGPRQTGWVGEP
jgi:hypothetical protein